MDIFADFWYFHGILVPLKLDSSLYCFALWDFLSALYFH